MKKKLFAIWDRMCTLEFEYNDFAKSKYYIMKYEIEEMEWDVMINHENEVTIQEQYQQYLKMKIEEAKLTLRALEQKHFEMQMRP